MNDPVGHGSVPDDRDEFYWAARTFIYRIGGDHLVPDPRAIEAAVQKSAAIARRYAKLAKRTAPSEKP